MTTTASRFVTIVAMLLCLQCAHAEQAGSLKLIANIGEPEISLTRQQVRELYLGRAGALGMIPLNYAPGSRLRIIFNTRVIGLTESRIQSFWAQMTFTGRGTPPREFDTPDELMDALQRTPGAVAYVSGDTPVPAGFQTLYVLE